GYYSRARNLKKCAAILTQQHQGKLPADYSALRKLPGIGPYTAGAIASICYDLPHAAVDGNVLRVLARLFRYEEDIRDPKVAARFGNIIEQAFEKGVSPSLFNQAIMELGETVCLPNGVPHCEACPLSKSCLALQEHRLDTIPYRSKNNARKVRERTLLIIRDGERFVVRKRPDRGLLAGMYEFIGIERHLTKSEAVREAEQLGFEVLHVSALPEGVHIFTHLEWHMKAYELQVSSLHEYPSFSRDELQERAFPSAFKTWIDWYALRQ
ncbi:MAG: NUDIX domain-containing protein, partial [Solobacterium sp.]|nr:NUDIX domain-containing protein [Solobacterium sp.]